MKRNCETCRHWYSSDWAENWGGCEMADNTHGDADHPQTLAYALGCAEAVITLATHATFGCVQWEVKV